MSLLLSVFGLGLAAVLDFLKFLFNMFVFVGPAIVGVGAAAATTSVFGGNGAAKAAGAVVGAVAGVASGVAAPEIFEALGIILAIMVGLIGWLIFFALFMTRGINFLKAGGSRFATVAWGFIATELPLINMFPTFTPTIWSIVRSVRKEDREALKKWEAKNATQAKEQRYEQLARAQQIRTAQEQAQAEQEAANDNEEAIPEALPQAA